ncbi:1-deoxy-D-xylulose-5-phosphate synthase [Nitrococcus mobilis]|uniref:1-deoxy-D-xylulose-5-phosphate synthase n=1 Tax=Nitrococcus mobilis Nb-231 TaxID=314278 RepID=A4BP98_9GAMM|nr:1-deoxy-D-xylulose-5-phosphate synthase [Nitrococcus mobilis]EAR22399.1 1-deoxy-D-xylulose-5-phosphate synthase [Nitrococcus mobilis Nb-231]
MAHSLLESVMYPEALRQLPESQLPVLARELREFLLETVSGNGGHLGAGLGAVELTIALHYVFETPDDRLVWDVGHQAYPHKILTGRRERLHTIRKHGGLAPFPHRDESPYDTFAVGHAGTAIGAALGMALAAAQHNSQRRAVAVLGDGGMTCGMAYEALNHAGDRHPDLLVILNDNEMSISRNVGGLTNYLARCASSRQYTALREGGKRILQTVPPMWELAKRVETHTKGLVVPGTLFEELGFRYFGPIDGHHLPTLIHTLRNLRMQQGPRLLHVVTRKGKGYPPAEADQVQYHGVSPFDPKVGIRKSSTPPSSPTYSQVFGDWLCDMAVRDQRLVAITPAMREGSGLVRFSECFPERYFDTAIAEQHSVTLAAGMAADGLKPVVAIYSTFLQRAYDQLIHDVALQNLPVLFAVDRAGAVGADGATHQGAFDLSFMRCVPNMVIMAPADEHECRQMLYTGFLLDGPAAVRYPRGKGTGVAIGSEMRALPIGKAQIRRSGSGIAILAFGTLLSACLQVGERLGATVVNMRFVKPLDTKLLTELAAGHDLIVTVEDNVIAAGAGSAVGEALAKEGISIPLLQLGLPDRFIDHASQEEQLTELGLDADGILATLQNDSRAQHIVGAQPRRKPRIYGPGKISSDTQKHPAAKP